MYFLDYGSQLGDFSFKFRDQVNVGPQTGSNQNRQFLVASGHQGRSYLFSPEIHQSYLCKQTKQLIFSQTILINI